MKICWIAISYRSLWILDNLVNNEKDTGGNRVVVLQKDTVNAMDGLSKQRESVKNMGTRKMYT